MSPLGTSAARAATRSAPAHGRMAAIEAERGAEHRAGDPGGGPWPSSAVPAAPKRAASAPIRTSVRTGRRTSRSGRDGQQGDRLGAAAARVGVERAAVQLRALAGAAERGADVAAAAGGPATRISSASSPKRTPTSTPGASSSALSRCSTIR
jgi:hypothetical protein